MECIVKHFAELNAKELYEILRARATVFIEEQGIIYCDPDGVDYDAYHCFLMEDAQLVAYLRAYSIPEVADALKIGRVLSTERHKGYGKYLMRESMRSLTLRTGVHRFVLHSQLHAAPFYEKLGFRTVSEPYLEAGILHVTMEL